LLWVLGDDLSGAITVLPADGDAWPPDVDSDDNDHQENDPRENALRFSLAGVQIKFSAINDASGGLTIPTKGVGGSNIVKLPSREFEGVPENEYSMMTLANLIGMDVPDVRLIDVDAIGNLPDGMGNIKGQALAIEHFNRLSDGTKVHIENYAQVFGVYPEDAYKRANYRNIANVIGAEGSDINIAEFIRRLTFNMLIGNRDMHLKSWSLIYPDRRTAAHAPAYDFLSTIPYIPDNKAALNVSRTKRFDEFTEDELSHLAAGGRLPQTLVLNTARETVDLFHQHWHAEKANLPLSSDVVKAVDAHVLKLPIG